VGRIIDDKEWVPASDRRPGAKNNHCEDRWNTLHRRTLMQRQSTIDEQLIASLWRATQIEEDSYLTYLVQYSG
jgi:hypothetical protein